jgi:hypothetical protein
MWVIGDFRRCTFVRNVAAKAMFDKHEAGLRCSALSGKGSTPVTWFLSSCPAW